ncbi:zinc finger matrin-type protein 4 isoform X3 [Narcine bancroftii]|uniref:zinc finger matrin-type protein 4 isoform X3 n=1 Tax=Narcine bancroftii TaxID=1343680 RepID=UPI003831F7DE
MVRTKQNREGEGEARDHFPPTTEAKMKSAGTGSLELFTDSYCNTCNAQLISESQRVAHYESKKHANKVRLYYMLHPEDGGPPSKKLRPDNPIPESSPDSLPPATPIFPDLGPVMDNSDSGKFCRLCSAWFNNPMMAQQHYEGKKHKKNAARARLLQQLGETLDSEALRALKSSYSCNLCNVILNSVEQFHAHLQGSKHQSNLKERQWEAALSLSESPHPSPYPREEGRDPCSASR